MFIVSNRNKFAQKKKKKKEMKQDININPFRTKTTKKMYLISNKKTKQTINKI